MNKINDTAFSISMERDIYVFYLIKNPEEKAKSEEKTELKICCMKDEKCRSVVDGMEDGSTRTRRKQKWNWENLL